MDQEPEILKPRGTQNDFFDTKEVDQGSHIGRANNTHG